ncbi:hypothetical protein CCACVL1_12498 [Corchorus capsularis]|uniref:Uncharacterized protein n=1 Tax=Corchorus capsularis TaxID=210143 RepID=A0A1R3IFC3_COCAP|nr:hypothetical protein CCACVL1_12498 [Corchorus capsularis]
MEKKAFRLSSAVILPWMRALLSLKLHFNHLELKEAKLKPLDAGSSVRIGVLAACETIASGFYQEKLQNQVI